MAMIDEEMHQGSTSETRSSDRYLIQLKAYAKVDADERTGRNSRCTPVMVSISALSGTVKQRAPVDIVLVLHVHVRCMAPANWHDLLIKATELVVEKLGDSDRLAVVPSLSKETRIIFEDAVVVPVKPKLLPMSSENKAAACTAVKSSQAMRCNTPLLRDLESAESILYRRESKDKEERAGYIVVISNSNEDLSSMLTWRFRFVHAFGFRDARNARTMYTIASSVGSTYCILDEGDSISQAFVSAIDKITFTVEPVEVHLKCNEEVVLSAIHAPRICYFISYDKKMGIIWANARCGMTTNFIIYLDIPVHGDYSENEYGNLLNIQVKYGHPPISVNGPPLLTVRKGKEGSKEVAAEMVRAKAVEIVAGVSAEDKQEREELHGAAALLHDRWIDVDNSDYANEAAEAGLTSSLASEMKEMETRLLNNDLWLEYMLSWRSHQWWPRQPLTKDDIVWGGTIGTQNPKEADALPFHHRRKAMYRRETTEETQKEGEKRDNNVQLGCTIGFPQAATISHPLMRLRILAKVDALPAQMQRFQRGVPLLVHIEVLPVEEGLEEKRAPVDLVAVLDVSCRVQETKMKRMKLLDKAMGFTMEKLSHKDRLAIITVQSTVTKHAASLVEMTENGRSDYRKRLSELSSASMNNAQQPSSGREPLKKSMCVPISTTANMLSGTPGHGSNKLSKSMKHAIKLLDDRQADDKDRLGLIIVISDREYISTSLRSNYTVHSFSFRGTDNARAMHRICSHSNGIYALLHDRHDEITEAFMWCISKMTSTIAVHTQVNILCNHSSDVRLSRVESGRFKCSIDRRKKCASISAGSIYPGASRRFIIYLGNVQEHSYYSLSTILKVNMSWQHAPNRAEEKLDGVVAIVRGKHSKEVVQEIVRIEGFKIVSSVTDPGNEIDSVLSRVQELRKLVRVRAAYVGVSQPSASSSAMELDDDNLLTAMDVAPLSHMLSWLSFQGLCEKLPSGTG